jgi:hypothetical protein
LTLTAVASAFWFRLSRNVGTTREAGRILPRGRERGRFRSAGGRARTARLARNTKLTNRHPICRKEEEERQVADQVRRLKKTCL